tara:strand:+ start:155 stop:583 length:429 start_codon:yes stop_codon:yes gene_type:complete
MTNKVGRPKIELTDLRKDWKESIIELSKQGASIVELSVLLDISRDTFYALSDREPEFSDTVKKCKQYCEAWWLSKGRTELENKEFSYTGWYMNMKNRFSWADKKEIKEEVKKEVTTFNIDNLSLDELEQLERINEKLNRQTD